MILSNKSYKRRIKKIKKIKPLRGTLETRLVVRKGGLLEVSGGKGWRRQRRAGCRVLQESTRTGGTLWRAGSSSASWRQADTPLITIYSNGLRMFRHISPISDSFVTFVFWLFISFHFNLNSSRAANQLRPQLWDVLLCSPHTFTVDPGRLKHCAIFI